MTKAPHIVDMNDLADRIKGPREFAPPAVRGEALPALEQIKTFAMLPTKELDEVAANTRASVEELEREAQEIRDDYTRRTAKLIADFKRLQEGAELSKQAMKTLRLQCKKLDSLEEPGE